MITWRETVCKCGCGLNITTKFHNTINDFREGFGHPMTVSSGARCLVENTMYGGKAKSAHMEGRAADFVRTPELLAFCTKENLETYGLYMEHADSTPTWVHLTDRSPASGRRIFKP